jgi:hypothetical protein
MLPAAVGLGIPVIKRDQRDWFNSATHGVAYSHRGHMEQSKALTGAQVARRRAYGLVVSALILLGLGLALPAAASASDRWVAVSSGYLHTLAVKIDGTLWACGRNSFGELGLGGTADKDILTRVGTASGWAAVSGGDYYSLALKQDGTLWAWGDNASGELGLNDTTNRDTPTEVGSGTNWAAISCGAGHALALKKDGTLWAWGDNASGELGLNDTTNRDTPTEVGSDTNWAAISCRGLHALALKKDGTLWAWGDNTSGQLGLGDSSIWLAPTEVGSDTDWATVSTGYYHTLALKKDGSLRAWGDNSSGQLGLNDTTNRDTPTEVGSDTDWATVSCGMGRTLALKKDGTLWAWGYSSVGALGLGDTTEQDTPTEVGGDSDWAGVSSGYWHTLALKQDGSLSAWGLNAFGQLGLGNTANRFAPAQVGAPAREFSPNPDGWQFPNGLDKTSSDDLAVWSRLFGDSKSMEKKYQLQLQMAQKSGGAGIFAGGNCLGFATSSALCFTGDLSLNGNFGLSATYTTPWDWGPGELGYPQVDGDGNTIMGPMSKQAREEIEELQLSQYTGGGGWAIQARKVVLPSNDWVSSLVSALGTGPQVLCVWNDHAGHALLAFDSEAYDNLVHISVYDCNHPGDSARYLDIDSSTGAWAYGDSYGAMSCPGNGHDWISWVSPSLMKAELDLAPAYYYEPQALVFGASVAQIVDQEGHVSGGDGSTWTWEIPGIKPFTELDSPSGTSTIAFTGADPGGLTYRFTPDASGSYAAEFPRNGRDLDLGMSRVEPDITTGALDQVTVSSIGDAMAVAPGAPSCGLVTLVDDQAPTLAISLGFAPGNPGDRVLLSTADLTTGVAITISDEAALSDAPVGVGWSGGDVVPIDISPGGRAEVDLTGGAMAGQTVGETTITARIDDDRDGTWDRTTTATLEQPPADSQAPFIPSVDTTPPATTSNADADWHNATVAVALNATDNAGGSGMSGQLAKTEYKLDSSDWTTGTQCTVGAPLDHAGDGEHTLSYRSTDAAGNTETAKSATVKIDTTPPTTTASDLDDRWHNSAVVIGLAGNDALSGPAGTSYSLDGGTAAPCTGSLTISTAGIHALTYFSTDLAGNVETAKSATVKIDTGKPTSTATKNVTVKKGKKATLAFKISDPAPSCGSAKVTITIKLKKKTVKTIKLANVPANKARTYAFKVTLKKGNYTWTVRATDIAGNAGKASTAKTLSVK